MAKKDTIAALKALGITPDESKTDAVLKQELVAAQAVPGVPVGAVSISPEDNPADRGAVDVGQVPVSSKSKDPIVVKYRDYAGVPTERTFSMEVHGPDFAKLAEEFKATNVKQIIA